MSDVPQEARPARPLEASDYRMADAETRDVVETIAPRAEWKTTNRKF